MVGNGGRFRTASAIADWSKLDGCSGASVAHAKWIAWEMFLVKLTCVGFTWRGGKFQHSDNVETRSIVTQSDNVLPN